MNNIALITPVKNEIDNLPRFFSAIESSELGINTLIIVENDSVDGSKEYLVQLSLSHVKNLFIIEKSFDDKEYNIGFKYSEVIETGFKYLRKLPHYNNIDFVGILDSDCFIEPDYYKKLTDSFKNNNNLGITSGIIKYDDGQIEKVNKDHIRGSGRLWSIKCFLEMDDYYGLSPDSISTIKAKMAGYDVLVTKNAIMYSRPVNSRGDKSFRGKSAFYNGIPFSYVFMKALFYLLKDVTMSKGLLIGYFNQKYINEKNPDDSIVKYNKDIMLRKIKSFFR